MGEIARLLQANGRIPGRLRDALAITCSDADSPTTISELSQLVRCDRSTLTYQWRKVVRIGLEFRFEDWMSWVLLINAVARKRAGIAWYHAARGCGVHRDTLQRASIRLTGRGISANAQRGTVALCRDFLHKAVAPIRGFTLTEGNC
jgi:hypothetical protein